MKNLLYILPLFILSLCFTSCEKGLVEQNQNDLLLGVWIPVNYDNEITTYERAEKLADDNYGIVFKRNNIYLERMNSGWCGTPPICYANYDGVWNKSEEILDIKVDFWGGEEERSIEIVFLNETELQIKIN